MVKPRASGPVSPYLMPGFYDRALAEGRHRDIVGGRWEETGEAQMRLLLEAGLQPGHRVLDIGRVPCGWAACWCPGWTRGTTGPPTFRAR